MAATVDIEAWVEAALRHGLTPWSTGLVFVGFYKRRHHQLAVLVTICHHQSSIFVGELPIYHHPPWLYHGYDDGYSSRLTPAKNRRIEPLLKSPQWCHPGSVATTVAAHLWSLCTRGESHPPGIQLRSWKYHGKYD